MIKRILCLCLVAGLLLSFASCRRDGGASEGHTDLTATEPDFLQATTPPLHGGDPETPPIVGSAFET